MNIAKAVMQMQSLRIHRTKSENKEVNTVHTPPSPLPRLLTRQSSWRSGLRGGMLRQSSEVIKVPSKKEPVPRLRQAKHRQALADVVVYHKAAMTIQKAWRSRNARPVALLRLINSEARRRHMERPSFQERAHLFDEMEKDQDQGNSGPSIWQMMQCSTILKEVLEDVLTATKTCKRLDAGVQAFTEGLKRKQTVRRKCREIWQRIRPKLVAYSAIWNIIESQRRTEMHWEALRQLIATPKASAQKSEVEAHWDKVLRAVTSPPECASEVEAVLTFAPLAAAICA